MLRTSSNEQFEVADAYPSMFFEMLNMNFLTWTSYFIICKMNCVYLFEVLCYAMKYELSSMLSWNERKMHVMCEINLSYEKLWTVME